LESEVQFNRVNCVLRVVAQSARYLVWASIIRTEAHSGIDDLDLITRYQSSRMGQSACVVGLVVFVIQVRQKDTYYAKTQSNQSCFSEAFALDQKEQNDDYDER
jgi:hypothetical protein